MTARRLRWLVALLVVGLVGCDQGTKVAAGSALGGGDSVTVVPGVLDLHYAENRDSAFSVFRALGIRPSRALLTILPLATLGFVVVFWWRRRRIAGKLEHLAFAVTAAGALGNLVDRIFRGYVIDFICLHGWPVFNVADMAIVAGAILLGLSALSFGRSPPAPF